MSSDKNVASPQGEVAPVLIVTDGEFFLLQVKDQQHPWGGCGLWSLFGGKLEAGETPLEALLRELKEELDIELTGEEVRSLRPLPSVATSDKLGNRWTWAPYLLKLEEGQSFSPAACTEGHPILIYRSHLQRALDMEGKPLQRGKRKGVMQELFMPGIAEVLRWGISTLEGGGDVE